MPHLILEYTDNLPPFEVGQVLNTLNHTLAQAGFPQQDIKSRAYFLTTYQIGDGSTPTGFAALRLHTRLSDEEKKKEIAQALLSVLQEHIFTQDIPIQFTVDILPINATCYTKAGTP